MAFRVFYVWQNDVPNRWLWSTLEKACRECSERLGIDVLADRDTRGEVGAVPIDAVILEKIERSDLVVADVSPVTFIDVPAGPTGEAEDEHASRPRRKQVPNPNVMLELGYALASLGAKRVALLLPAETNMDEMPFDIRNARMQPFTQDRLELQRDLVRIIEICIAAGQHLPGTAEQRLAVRRLLIANDRRSPPPDGKRIGLELSLLAEAEGDLMDRLSRRFTEGPPSWNVAWLYGNYPLTSLMPDLHAVLAEVWPQTEREQALSRLESYLRGADLQPTVFELSTTPSTNGWPLSNSAGTAPWAPLGKEADLWLDEIEQLGLDVTTARHELESWRLAPLTRDSHRGFASASEELASTLRTTDPTTLQGAEPPRRPGCAG